jgi:hypothetical protein
VEAHCKRSIGLEKQHNMQRHLVSLSVLRVAAMHDPPVAAHQVAIFVLLFGYVISFVCSAIVEWYENKEND